MVREGLEVSPSHVPRFHGETDSKAHRRPSLKSMWEADGNVEIVRLWDQAELGLNGS